ncbi:Transcription factor TGA6 [Glycine soja]
MEATNVHPSRISEFGTLDQSLGFRVEDTNCLNLSYIQKHAYFYSKIWCFIVFWQSERCESSGSKDKSDQKTLRRLAQNCEAARKSRLRKKAYQQQLESSRLKLTQLEQELQRARQ